MVFRLRFGMVGLELFWVVFGFGLSNLSIRSIGVGDWLGTGLCFVHYYSCEYGVSFVIRSGYAGRSRLWGQG